jgi:ABC-type multidrug transport system fused ATPase/permease subunit
LFFQVVIDKVLVHRGLSTLEVLTIGLATIAVFEAILGALRTYLFAHTTNRIDVELGARLFRHLMSPPLAYFLTRRAGDSIARVRELENIRNFLTSSALTLVIDLVFTVVFLGVMVVYSPWLSEPNGQELVYAARVGIDRAQMEIEGRPVQLLPGMAVTVEIKTGSRRIISYLLSPLVRYRQEVLRER